jgi:hypothetical protein
MFTSTCTAGRDLFDRLVPRRLNHLTAGFNVSPVTIVNVLVTVNVNGMNRRGTKKKPIFKPFFVVFVSFVVNDDLPLRSSL